MSFVTITYVVFGFSSHLAGGTKLMMDRCIVWPAEGQQECVKACSTSHDDVLQFDLSSAVRNLACTPPHSQ